MIPVKEVSDYIRAGKKVPAIKLVRESTGLGLKEAKEYVDELERTLKNNHNNSKSLRHAKSISSIASMEGHKFEKNEMDDLEEELAELEEEMKNYVVQNPGMNLKQNEICFYQCTANAVHIKNVVLGTQRSSIYLGSRRKSSFSLGTGFSTNQNVRGDVAEKYPGHLFVTNQRIVLSSIRHGFEIQLKNITTLDFMSDGFSVMSKGKTYLVETENANDIKRMIQINNEYMMLSQALEKNRDRKEEKKENTERVVVDTKAENETNAVEWVVAEHIEEAEWTLSDVSEADDTIFAVETKSDALEVEVMKKSESVAIETNTKVNDKEVELKPELTDIIKESEPKMKDIVMETMQEPENVITEMDSMEKYKEPESKQGPCGVIEESKQEDVVLESMPKAEYRVKEKDPIKKETNNIKLTRKLKKEVPNAINHKTKEEKIFSESKTYEGNKSIINKIIKILLWFTAITLALFVLVSFTLNVEFKASTVDLWIYRLSAVALFLPLLIGVLLELNVFKLKNKIPLIRTGRISGHIGFAFLVTTISVLGMMIVNGFLSDEFQEQIAKQQASVDVGLENSIPITDTTVRTEKNMENEKESSSAQASQNSIENDKATTTEESIKTEKINVTTWKDLSKERYKEIVMLLGQNFPEYNTILFDSLETDDEKNLVAELYECHDTYGELPDDFKEAFTLLCDSEEYESMYYEESENFDFFETVSMGFQISWKLDGTFFIDVKPEKADIPDKSNEYITDEDPLVFTLNDETYTVGNCSFSINEIRVASFPFKIGSRSVFFRIYGTVKNNSDEETFFTTTKAGNIVGTYYGGEEDEIIGGNTACSWKEDKGKEIFSTGYTLAPGEQRELKIQATYVTTDKPTYAYKLDMDLYFRNNDELFTLTIY